MAECVDSSHTALKQNNKNLKGKKKLLELKSYSSARQSKMYLFIVCESEC